jgi:hypothetical protein
MMGLLLSWVVSTALLPWSVSTGLLPFGLGLLPFGSGFRPFERGPVRATLLLCGFGLLWGAGLQVMIDWGAPP